MVLILNGSASGTFRVSVVALNIPFISLRPAPRFRPLFFCSADFLSEFCSFGNKPFADDFGFASFIVHELDGMIAISVHCRVERDFSPSTSLFFLSVFSKLLGIRRHAAHALAASLSRAIDAEQHDQRNANQLA